MTGEVVEAPTRPPRKSIKRKSGVGLKPKQRSLKRRVGLKKKKTSLTKADGMFSELVRQRDGGCLFPGCGRHDQLTCSHYFGRAVKSTRFDLDNCITLCRTHHYWDKMVGWEFQKQREEEHGWDGRYTAFMKTWLGEERWNALLKRSKVHVSQRKAIDTFMETAEAAQLPAASGSASVSAKLETGLLPDDDATASTVTGNIQA